VILVVQQLVDAQFVVPIRTAAGAGSGRRWLHRFSIDRVINLLLQRAQKPYFPGVAQQDADGEVECSAGILKDHEMQRWALRSCNTFIPPPSPSPVQQGDTKFRIVKNQKKDPKNNDTRAANPPPPRGGEFLEPLRRLRTMHGGLPQVGHRRRVGPFCGFSGGPESLRP